MGELEIVKLIENETEKFVNKQSAWKFEGKSFANPCVLIFRGNHFFYRINFILKKNISENFVSIFFKIYSVEFSPWRVHFDESEFFFYIFLDQKSQNNIIFKTWNVVVCVCVWRTWCECVWCVRMAECNDRFRKTSDRETADYNRNDYNEKCHQPRRRRRRRGRGAWKGNKIELNGNWNDTSERTKEREYFFYRKYIMRFCEIVMDKKK